MRGEAFRYLADEFDPDFGFVQFQKTDTVFHELSGEKRHIDPVYEATDEQIASILEACDPDRVFLVSDHGMGSYDGYEFRINEYLRDVGFLETTTGGKGMPSWTPMRRRLREGEEYDTWEPGTVARAASVAARFGVTARRVRTALERVGLADVAIEHAPGGITRTANEQVDFAESEAYVRAGPNSAFGSISRAGSQTASFHRRSTRNSERASFECYRPSRRPMASRSSRRSRRARAVLPR